MTAYSKNKYKDEDDDEDESMTKHFHLMVMKGYVVDCVIAAPPAKKPLSTSRIDVGPDFHWSINTIQLTSNLLLQ